MGLRALRLGLLSALFVGAGCLHVVNPEPFVQIVPPFIPWPGWAVLVSGIAEIAGGIGVLVPATRLPARWGLVTLLIAVFPANIYMAAEKIAPAGMTIAPWLLWGRLLLQPLLIWWVIAATKRTGAAAGTTAPAGSI
jgi:uncharacterized membrane protein